MHRPARAVVVSSRDAAFGEVPVEHEHRDGGDDQGQAERDGEDGSAQSAQSRPFRGRFIAVGYSPRR